MINKKFGKDLFLVVLSNGVKLLSSILTVFVIPLIFTQQDYGFYKLFLLYVSYVGIFHFGFNDGIYLYYAGKDYEELDKAQFRTYTKFLAMMQSIIAIIILGISFFLSGDRQIIVFLVGINLIVLNLTTYYQFISQVTQRFKEFAVRNIIYTVFNVLLIGIFYLLEIMDYKLFLVFTVAINLILLLWYVFSYKEITFGKTNRFMEQKDGISLMFKLGILLLFSNLVVMFFSSIPRQFVEINFPVELYPDIFSNFSFAYTLMGFTGVFLSAVSMVLYPTLRKSSDEELKNRYNDFNSSVIVLVFILIIAFFPLSYIVQRFLPNYTNAVEIFFVLAPGISITSAVTVVIHNYFKTLNKNKEFLIIGVINLALLTGAIYLVHNFISQEIIYIAVTTVLVELIWFLTLDYYLNKEYNKISYRNISFIIIASLLFYSTLYLDGLLLGTLVYGVGIALLTFLFYFDKIKQLLLYFTSNKPNKID